MLRNMSWWLGLSLVAGGSFVISACGDDDDTPAPCSGSSCASGGKTSSGGARSGGSSSVSGGETQGTSGGATANGGTGNVTSQTGGKTATGGVTSGGASSTNGGTSTQPEGGTQSNGGTTQGTSPEGGMAGGGAGGEAGGDAGAGQGGVAGEGGTTSVVGGGGAGGEPQLGLSVIQGSNQLNIAPGGVNFATLDVQNQSEIPIQVTVAATSPNGAEATPLTQVLPLAVDQTSTATLRLNGTNVTTGTGALSVTISAPGIDPISRTFGLTFSADLALNSFPDALPVSYPKAMASSSQGTQPPKLAFDAQAGTFWVSSGSLPGQGPKPTAPEWLGVDFGAPVSIGKIVMTPRGQRGPTAYTVEVSDDQTAWDSVAEEPTAADAAVTTTLTSAVTKRYLRILITGSRDPGHATACPQPCDPRNVQIISLEVFPPAVSM